MSLSLCRAAFTIVLFLTTRVPPSSTLFPYTTLFRSAGAVGVRAAGEERLVDETGEVEVGAERGRSEEHTSELQSLRHLVCRLLLEKKKKPNTIQLLFSVPHVSFPLSAFAVSHSTHTA